VDALRALHRLRANRSHSLEASRDRNRRDRHVDGPGASTGLRRLLTPALPCAWRHSASAPATVRTEDDDVLPASALEGRIGKAPALMGPDVRGRGASPTPRACGFTIVEPIDSLAVLVTQLPRS